MLPRPRLQHTVSEALTRSPITALLGPRQCGKTTLARLVAKGREHTWFDLEDPAAAQSLEEPALALTDLHGLVVIDEVQLGASWEGFALEQTLSRVSGDPYFGSTHNGAELDLVLMRKRDRVGIEFKHNDAPAKTVSMATALPAPWRMF